MKKHLQLLKWILGFIFLNVFANGVPFWINNYPETIFAQLFIQQPLYWIGFWLSFFLLAFLIARFFLKVQGLRSMGLKSQNKWVKDLVVGFSCGFIIWAIKNLLFFGMGKFDLTGLIDPSAIPGLLALAFLISFFPAAINDLLLRGYFLAWFRRYNLMAYFVLVTSLLYAFDDFWNESLSVTNFIFSLLLGIALAITVVRTGAIWMSIGIHTGSNFLYRMMNGLDGQGIFILENFNENVVYEYINIIVVIFLIPLALLIPKNSRENIIISGKETQLDESAGKVKLVPKP